MKTLIKIILVQICCIPLLITDAMAKEGGRDKGKGGKSSKVSRPTSRPSNKSSRNPITSSKAPRPSSKPASKPASRPERPTTKPAPKPDRPSSKPANDRPQSKPSSKPDRPDKERPSTKPNFPDKERPSTKPNLPDKERPSTKPNFPDKERPSTKPNLPDKERPSTKPNFPDKERPSTKPNFPDKERPSTKPNFPDKKPVRPETKPGNIKYPKPEKPTTLPGKRPDKKPEVRPGQNSRPIKKPDFNKPDKNPGTNGKRPNQNNWWESNRKETNIKNNNNKYTNNNINNYNFGDKNVTYKKEVNINNNFKNNVNWSTKKENWGYNPWWNRPATRPWYGGSWNCGWNNNYYRSHHHYSTHTYYGGYRPYPGYVVYDDHDDNDALKAIGWGLVGWSLGKMVFDSGYHSYSNPYPAQPVPSAKGTQVTYNQPITVVAAETAPPQDEADKVTEASESHIAAARESFKAGDYLAALEGSNKAVSEAPGDGALHEFRALVLFTLGKYSEAAGVLNPVLAGGPGWDWSTMITLYNSQETYMNQLSSLQKYSGAKPDAADAHFLLGYHYMVCGHLKEANAEFETAAKLQPADSVSAQLRDLTKASSNSGEDDASGDEPAAEEQEAPAPDPVPLEKLTGTWVSDKGAQGTVTLAFKDDGKFIWTFKKDDKSNEFAGDFSMNDNGLLVLDSEDSQMVAAVELPQDGELKFVLAGGPPGDPGLMFAKK